MHRDLLQKTIIIAGFGLTILVDLLYTWGGWVFESSPFLDFQSLLVVWSIPHELTNVFVFLLLALFSRKFQPKHAKVTLPTAAVLLIIGHMLLLSIATFSEPLLGIVLAALCIGTGTTLLLASWVLIFSGLLLRESQVLILISMAVYAIVFQVINSLPPAIFSYTPPVLIVIAVSACMVVMHMSTRGGRPFNSPKAYEVKKPVPVWQSIVSLRSPLFCAASIVFAVPVTRISALVDSVDIVWMNSVTSMVIIALVAVLLLLRYGSGNAIRFLQSFDIPSLFIFSLPIVATALVLYTVIGSALALPASVTVFVLFYLVWLLMIPACVSTARKLGTSPLLCYGIAGCIVNLVFAGSTALGAFLLAGELFFGAATLSVCMLLVLYVFMMTFSIQNRRIRKSTGKERLQKSENDLSQINGNVEFYADAGAVTLSAEKQDTKNVLETTPTDASLSLIEQICNELSETHLLTPRESDILLLMANGRDAPYISKQLFISKNTVRTHIKNVYVKLNVHSRQDLLDLIQDTRLLL